MTTRMDFLSFRTTLSALINPASTTIAVPCWSSCITGIESSFFKRVSISKQRGAEISSKLMPPNVGAIALTAATISSASCVESTIGKPSIFAKRLKSTALPSMMGSAASGPMLPSPSTAEPSEMIATPFFVAVRLYASFLFLAMASAGPATPGV